VDLSELDGEGARPERPSRLAPKALEDLGSLVKQRKRRRKLEPRFG
jgi:hypothetical protein